MKAVRRIVAFLILLTGSNLAHAQSVQWESPESVAGADTIGVDQAVALHKSGALFVDVRSARQYQKRHIPAAKHLYINGDFTELSLLQFAQHKNTPLVIYCNGINCSLSSKAVQMAVAWGFTQVKYFRAGIRAWRLSGNPLEHGPQR